MPKVSSYNGVAALLGDTEAGQLYPVAHAGEEHPAARPGEEHVPRQSLGASAQVFAGELYGGGGGGYGTWIGFDGSNDQVQDDPDLFQTRYLLQATGFPKELLRDPRIYINAIFVLKNKFF